MSQDESIFTTDVESKSINFLQKVIFFSLKVLSFLMAFVILCSVFDVGYLIYTIVKTPPHRILNLEDVLSTLGSFLIVLIAIEIFINIIMYFRRETNHIKLVVATALMAISRKVIILDYEHASQPQLIAMALLIFALGFAYWFCKGPEKIFSFNKTGNLVPDKDIVN